MLFPGTVLLYELINLFSHLQKSVKKFAGNRMDMKEVRKLCTLMLSNLQFSLISLEDNVKYTFALQKLAG